MNPSPAVSIIIPAYGHSALIGRTLQSVMNQAWTDYEIIVINDGSPDDTEVVLQPYIAAGNIRYVLQQNAGVASARNHGISLAKGEFIALLDDDDLWPSDKLDWQVAQLRTHPEAAMVYGSLTVIDANDVPHVILDSQGEPLRLHCDGPDNPGPSDQVYEAFLEDNWITSPGQTLIRRSALQQIKSDPFDITLKGTDDWDLWLRLAERHSILYNPRVALQYRLHRSNTSKNVMMMRENGLKLLRKHRRRQIFHSKRHRLLAQKFRESRDFTYSHIFHLAWQDYDNGWEQNTSPKLLREGLDKLLYLARIHPIACLNQRYFRLFQGISKALLGYNRSKVSL